MTEFLIGWVIGAALGVIFGNAMKGQGTALVDKVKAWIRDHKG